MSAGAISKFFVAATALALVGAFVALPAASAPQITSPEPIYDFGMRDNTGVVEHDFVVANTGDAPLEIYNVSTSCGCTVAKPADTKLAPGESTTIHATLNLRGRRGPQNKTISVQSNDPDDNPFRLGFSGVAAELVEVNPSRVHFGAYPSDEVREETVTIRAGKEGYTFDITSVTSPNEAVKADLKVVAPGKHYELLISTAKDIRPVPFNSPVILKTNDPEKPSIMVQVGGAPHGDISITPGEIVIRYHEQGRTSQYLSVGPGRVKDFKITEVEVPGSDTRTSFNPSQSGRYLVKLEGLPADGTLHGKNVLIHTDIDGGKVFEVPIKNERTSPLRPPATSAARQR